MSRPLPAEALEHADAVVVGEGEVSWPDVLADLARGRLRGLYTPNGREFDLADAPMPRFDLLDIERYNRLTVQTQRGCPWRCEFCAASIRLTPKYKVKPIARVLARDPRDPTALAAAVHRVRRRQHVRQSAPLQGALPRAGGRTTCKWFTETDISVADDPELLT